MAKTAMIMIGQFRKIFTKNIYKLTNVKKANNKGEILIAFINIIDKTAPIKLMNKVQHL